MQESMKKEINDRYHEILRKLYINWKFKSKSKYEELRRQGLDSSGHAITSMHDLIQALVYISIEDLDNMIKEISKEFNDKIPYKELKKYINNFEEALYGHVDSMEKDVEDKFRGLISICEPSLELWINNIKGNIKSKFKK